MSISTAPKGALLLTKRGSVETTAEPEGTAV